MYNTSRLISDLLSHTSNVRWAVYSARLVLDKHEAKHPDDKTAREAIEAAESWIEYPSSNNRERCRKAVNVAYYAACATYAATYDAAYAAAYATRAAAHYATDAAARAADAAYYAARAAYYAAYWAIKADPDAKPLILRYGVELLIAEGKDVPDEFRGIEMDIGIEKLLEQNDA